MNILFLSSWFPYPPINGAKIRVNNLLKYLVERHEVTLISFVHTLPWTQVQSEIESIRRDYRRVLAIPYPKPKPSRELLGYFSKLPRHLIATFSQDFHNAICYEVESTTYDVVITAEIGDGTGAAFYAGKIRDRPKILDCIEAGAYVDRVSREVPIHRRWRSYLTWTKYQQYLRELLSNFKVCTVPSATERDHLAKIAPASTQLEVVPHSLNLSYLHINESVRPDSNSLVFNGSLTYFPNNDAVQFFTEKILPKVQAEIPTVKVSVLGDTGDFNTCIQKRGALEFRGLLRDVRSEIWRSSASVVPLRYGSGTRVKILESMALGTPVVSTSKGAEGLDVTHEQNILIADDPADFAAQTVRLLRDPTLRRKLVTNARQLVEEKYDWRIIGNRFNDMMESVVKGVGSGGL